MIKNFLQELRTQRWDDHRFYHHSRINQSLHFVSAVSFLFAYVMLFFDPVVSALVGWLVSMTRVGRSLLLRAKGDHVNQATHERKDNIKVGYNPQRKVVLMAIWALSPMVLYAIRPCSAVLQVTMGIRPSGRQISPWSVSAAFVPHHPFVLHPRRRDRSRLDDQDRHRSLPRPEAPTRRRCS